MLNRIAPSLGSDSSPLVIVRVFAPTLWRHDQWCGSVGTGADDDDEDVEDSVELEVSVDSDELIVVVDSCLLRSICFRRRLGRLISPTGASVVVLRQTEP